MKSVNIKLTEKYKKENSFKELVGKAYPETTQHERAHIGLRYQEAIRKSGFDINDVNEHLENKVAYRYGVNPYIDFKAIEVLAERLGENFSIFTTNVLAEHVYIYPQDVKELNEEFDSIEEYVDVEAIYAFSKQFKRPSMMTHYLISFYIPIPDITIHQINQQVEEHLQTIFDQENQDDINNYYDAIGKGGF